MNFSSCSSVSNARISITTRSGSSTAITRGAFRLRSLRTQNSSRITSYNVCYTKLLRVWADYAGGAVRKGHLLGTVSADGGLAFTYHHMRSDGARMTGECRSTLTVLDDGRYRLDEEWRWTCGDGSRSYNFV